MIPKVINYCWFGRGEKPKLAEKCIASWKKYCPDYEIIEWNEDNFDVNMNGYTKMCYENKKYAFLTDYIRLLVVKEHGGIYFDTDVEVLKPFDDLLNDDAFFGFENNESINSGEGFGSVKDGTAITAMLKEYDNLLAGKNGVVMCPQLNTQALLPFGLKLNGQKQRVADAVIYPADYFNPMNSLTGKIEKTKNTYSIHRYSMSWLSPKQRAKSYIVRNIKRVFGENCLNFLKR